MRLDIIAMYNVAVATPEHSVLLMYPQNENGISFFFYNNGLWPVGMQNM